MDIQTFSEKYWYIWFLATLLLVILLLLNGLGVLFYRQKRRRFVNRLDNSMSMSENSVSPIQTKTPSKYRQISVISTIGNELSLIDPANYNSFSLRNSEPITIPRGETSFTLNDRSEMDLLLEEFQRDALKEHNSMRAMYHKSPLKLSESLNLFAQSWAERCARMNTISPSPLEWRSHCKDQPLGENILSVKSTDALEGSHFTALIMANGNSSVEVDCVLNEISTEVGFGRAQSQTYDHPGQQQWIGVAHYYPYRQLTTVQS